MTSLAARVALLAVLGAALSVSQRAHASPDFPGVMNDALSLGCAPACTLCHQGEAGFGTTNTPFGMKMRREARLRCCNEEALEDALALFRERGIDSDEDGTPDVDELVAGSDPNGPGALACERPFVSDGSRVFGEGCNAAAAPSRAPADGTAWDATAIALTFAAIALVVRVRTRRARQAS